VKITVERCDEFLVAVSQIFDRVKSVALWSVKKKERKRTVKGYGSAASVDPIRVQGPGWLNEIGSWIT
jgi:hypothetical protein